MKITIDRPLAMRELGQRDNQEDTIYPAKGAVRPSDRVFVVCDGMGGHDHGEVASDIVARTVGECLAAQCGDQALPDEAIVAALDEAHALLDADKNASSGRSMGTTLTLLALHRGGATVAHVGDSRIYHLRPATGEVLYWSRDHSLVMELWQSGEITREQMATHARRNVITRAITAGGDRVAPDIVHITDVKPGDWFVLCTDGVLENVEHDQLLEMLGKGDELEKLVAATTTSHDNHSAYLVRVADVQLEAGDESLASDEADAPCNVMRFIKKIAEREAAVVAVDDVQVVDADEEPVEVVEERGGHAARWAVIAVVLALVVAAVILLSRGGEGDKPAANNVPVEQTAEPQQRGRFVAPQQRQQQAHEATPQQQPQPAAAEKDGDDLGEKVRDAVKGASGKREPKQGLSPLQKVKFYCNVKK